MCSLNDYRCNVNDDAAPQDTKNPLIDTTLCRKCRCKNVDVLLIGQSGYCQMCFLIVTNHKFRAAIGKSKIIRHGDSILVDHSGELNSTVLLHLIKSGMSESAHKKLIFKTTVLYIDDSAVLEKTDKEHTLRHKIAEQTRDLGFDGYVVSLSQALNKEDALDINLMDCQQIKNEANEQLHEILTNLPDNTSRIDLLCQLRRKLLISTARKINCNKVFVADSATNIAAKVLGDICLGRGAQLSSLANFCDSRCADIKILKPIRDFTKQELNYYAECYKINPIKLNEIHVITPANSIQVLAHNFTVELESQFSGTVSTISRTAEKLSTRYNEHQDVEDSCVLCDANLDSVFVDGEISAIRSIEISKLVSCKHIHERTSLKSTESEESDYMSLQTDSKSCCNDNSSCKNSKKEQVTSEDIWKCLCYSCKMIFRNSESMHILPASLLYTVQQRLALKDMRKKINDFLL